MEDVPPPQRLRLLSANIQAGARTDGFGHYLTRFPTQVLPHPSKLDNLGHLARHLAEFDLVGLQETDPGSLRSGFLDQTHYLALQAGFPCWHHQPNRRVGRLATSANGLLSRLSPQEVRHHPLPGRIPGRGVLWARFAVAGTDLVVMIAHLSLGARSRLDQLAFIAELAQDCPHAVLMGDLNCEPESNELRAFFRRSGFEPPDCRLPSFPSWRPRRCIDHILATPGVPVLRRWLLPNLASDHLGMAAEIMLPQRAGNAAGASSA
ncbi:MAG: endonuclease [Lysobacteraceae bacterium]|nr:MAG: endonuclease [Xanthomonadaceae bacterium]